jgi:hypothetical protein
MVGGDVCGEALGEVFGGERQEGVAPCEAAEEFPVEAGGEKGEGARLVGRPQGGAREDQEQLEFGRGLQDVAGRAPKFAGRRAAVHNYNGRAPAPVRDGGR